MRVKSTARDLKRVIVCHPGRQHSHQLAMALANAGMLRKYITGTPSHPDVLAMWQRPFMRRYIEAYQLPLDPQLIEHHFIAPIVRNTAACLLNRSQAVAWSHRADAMFDHVAARRVGAIGADVVVAYENAAEAIFCEAKRCGAVTVLDAASFHHCWQDRFYRHIEPPPVHQRIVQRKNREMDLADYIITVSQLARASYVEAGVPAQRVISMPLGADTLLFHPKSESRHSETVRFLFVGNISDLKGADVLFEATERLSHCKADFELTLIGKTLSSINFNTIPQCRLLGWLPHSQLANEIRNHDVLVLPSRLDSFAMVVLEAMASGLPTIVTESVGAKDAITAGKNGLIVPVGDVAALRTAMQWFIDHSECLPDMSASARAAAEKHDWSSYHEQAIRVFQSLERDAGTQQ